MHGDARFKTGVSRPKTCVSTNDPPSHKNHSRIINWSAQRSKKNRLGQPKPRIALRELSKFREFGFVSLEKTANRWFLSESASSLLTVAQRGTMIEGQTLKIPKPRPKKISVVSCGSIKRQQQQQQQQTGEADTTNSTKTRTV